jgi:hypothetical protein
MLFCFFFRRRFGFTDLKAVQEGKSGSDCRGEENEVSKRQGEGMASSKCLVEWRISHIRLLWEQIELIWSIKGEKTRVIWNKKDISHCLKETTKRNLTEMAEFDWESRSGERLEISASALPRVGRPQYDFLVGGVSFFALPHVSELGPNSNDDATSSIGRRSDGIFPVNTPDGSISILSGAELRTANSMDYGYQPEDLDFRLSMAGFGSTEPDPFEIVDDLNSELYSCKLESLRHRVTSCISDTEEIVSRAIINAFSEDRDSSHKSDESSSWDSDPQNAPQIQVDVIWDTYEWMRLNLDDTPRRDVEDQHLSFMQKQVDAMFSHVRHEMLTIDAAARILINVAIVLGRKLKIPAPIDTIVLRDLEKNVRVENLLDSLCIYGDVATVAVSKGRRFGK